jgi:hypothetical protein
MTIWCLTNRFEACSIADMPAMCFTLMISQLSNLIAAVAMLFAMAFLCSCTSPISDPAKLRTIESEARLLMVDHPVSPSNAGVDIPMNRWPPGIAGLKPEAVAVNHWGVDITVRADMDGGYGYAVPKNRRDLPMPAKCYSELQHSVFWHGPC